ncbi:serine hydrolase [Enterobacter hormaechei]
MQASDGGGKGASPCNNTLAAIGSGGVYSTPGDMMRWMQQFLSSDFYARSNQADRMQTLIYQRAQLRRVIGMDVPGKADALGMGWVYMAPKDGRPGIIQKTGGRWRIHHLYGDDSAIKRRCFCGGHPVAKYTLREYE